MSRQKFKRGSRVKVAKNLGSMMSHYDSDFEGIVVYTYAQEYGGSNVNSYCLLVLNEKGRPINEISWYQENQLTQLEGTRVEGLDLIEEFEYEDDEYE